MIRSREKENLIREIVAERLAYHPPGEWWGEKIARQQETKKKTDKLTPEECRWLEREIERIKFERVKALFENFYR